MDCRHLEDIIKQLADGIDPTTGEIIPDEAYADPGVFKAIKALSARARLAYKGKRISRNLLGRPVDRIFEELKAWRLEEARDRSLPAFVIFSDADLRSIAEGDVIEKDDLLKVKGFGPKKMELYGDAVYAILRFYIAGNVPEEIACGDSSAEQKSEELPDGTRENPGGDDGILIGVGSFVRILDVIYDEELSFAIVDRTTKTHYLGYTYLHGERVQLSEQVLESGGDGFSCITPQSELGSHLMGKSVGDTVAYTDSEGNSERFIVLDVMNNRGG